jgi:hypothetical protein
MLMLAPTALASEPRRWTTTSPATRSQVTQKKSSGSASMFPGSVRSIIARARPPRSSETRGSR